MLGAFANEQGPGCGARGVVGRPRSCCSDDPLSFHGRFTPPLLPVLSSRALFSGSRNLKSLPRRSQHHSTADRDRWTVVGYD